MSYNLKKTTCLNKSFQFQYKIRAGAHALFFVQKSDDWGKMFSYNPWIPKLFPKFSEFDMLRENSMKYYNCIKVCIEPD